MATAAEAAEAVEAVGTVEAAETVEEAALEEVVGDKRPDACAGARHCNDASLRKKMQLQVPLAPTCPRGEKVDIQDAMAALLAATLPARPTLKAHGEPEDGQLAMTVSCVRPAGGDKTDEAFVEILAHAVATTAGKEWGMASSVVAWSPRARVIYLSLTVNWKTPRRFCDCATCAPADDTTAWSWVAVQ